MANSVVIKASNGVLERRKEKWGYIFLLPWLIIFLVFYLYPLGYGLVTSFTNYNLSGVRFNGIENYKKLFSDYAFWRSLWGTLRYAFITIPLRLLLPLWIANTLRGHSAKVNSAVKLLVYIPSVTCSVALVVVWNFIFWPNRGLLANVLEVFSVSGFSVFDNANISIPIIALLIVFSNMGQNVVIFCGGLDAIPLDYYEAAELDGASRGQQFRNITVPMLYPTIIYVLITNTIASLQIFVIPQLMTGGGPNYASSTLLMLIYNTAFSNNQFGYASAIGMVLFIITSIIAIIQFRVTQRESIEY